MRGATQDTEPVHEYRKLHDTLYPRLVNAQCTCGWRMAGYTAAWIAFSYFERHRDTASARRSREGK